MKHRVTRTGFNTTYRQSSKIPRETVRSPRELSGTALGEMTDPLMPPVT